jgi:predicted ATPase
MAARRPAVLVVEDLHWADDALLDFLEHLLDWTAAVPLVVPVHRSAPSSSSDVPLGRRQAERDDDLALTADERRFKQAPAGSPERSVLAAETQSLLLERAGGNPLYAEQFARMLVERGDAEGIAVPETVHALVAARLDTLRPELKSLLHDAAVVGRVFWLGAVAAIGGHDRAEVRRDLNELVRREFVSVRSRLVDRGRGRAVLLACARPRRRLSADPPRAACGEARRCCTLGRNDRW